MMPQCTWNEQGCRHASARSQRLSGSDAGVCRMGRHERGGACTATAALGTLGLTRRSCTGWGGDVHEADDDDLRGTQQASAFHAVVSGGLAAERAHQHCTGLAQQNVGRAWQHEALQRLGHRELHAGPRQHAARHLHSRHFTAGGMHDHLRHLTHSMQHVRAVLRWRIGRTGRPRASHVSKL